MAKTILLEEFHVSVRVPRGLPPSRYEAMHRTLTERSFQNHLRRAVRAVLHAYPVLHPVRVYLTR